jgi:predicted MFS family arabinose efflux permease
VWLPLAFVSGAESLLVPYAERNGHPPGSAGLLLACVPVGMIVGNVVTTRLRPALRERLTVWLIVLLGTPLLIFALALAPVPAALLLFTSACGFSYILGIQRRYVEVVPDDLRGQGFTLMSTGVMTLQGLGPIVFGALGEFLSAGPIIALAGVATLLTALTLRTKLGVVCQ